MGLSSETNYLPLTYNSDGYYTIKATSNEGHHYAKWITSLTGEDNLKLSCEVMTNTLNTTNRFGIVVGDADALKSERFQFTNNSNYAKAVGHIKMYNNIETVINYQSINSLNTNTWYRMEWTIQGTSFTFKLYDMSDNELYSETGTFDSSVITSTTNKQYGLYYLNYSPSATKYYRNIKAEYI